MIVPGVVLDDEDLSPIGSLISILESSRMLTTSSTVTTRPIGSKPAHGGTPSRSGGRRRTEDWRKAGGSTIFYMTPPRTLQTAAPRTFGYRVPSPVSPLLGLGFGLNLLLLAHDILGFEGPEGPLDPWGEPMAY